MARLVAVLCAIAVVFAVIFFYLAHTKSPASQRAPSATTATSIATTSPPDLSTLPIDSVGKITRHANLYIGEIIRIQGYLLKKYPTYLLVSDEATGPITKFDLPVTGPGIDSIQPGHLYLFVGRFLDQGFVSSNANSYHVELSVAPKEAT